MKNKIQVKMSDSITPVNFPEFCIYCDQAAETQEKHSFKFDEGDVEYKLPYCKSHAKIYLRNKVLDLIILSLCTLIGFAGLFLFSFDFIPEWIVDMAPGYAVIIAVVLIALLFYFPLKFIVGLILKSVSGYPLDNPLGIWITYLYDTKTLLFEIENDDFAQRFESYEDKIPSGVQLEPPVLSNIPEVDHSAPEQTVMRDTSSVAEISSSSETAAENTSVCPKCQRKIETYDFSCPHCGHTQWELIGCSSVVGLLAGGFVVFRIIRENATGFLFWVGVVIGVLFVALTLQSVYLAIKRSKT